MVWGRPSLLDASHLAQMLDKPGLEILCLVAVEIGWKSIVCEEIVKENSPKAALLFRFLKVALLSICLWYASIVATCIAAHFALCCALK